MNKPNLNKIRFLAYFIIFVLVFSIIPIWKSELVFGSINDEDGIEKITANSNKEIDYWFNLLNLPDPEQLQVGLDKSSLYGSEIVSERTQNAKVFVNPDNLVTYKIYSGNVHYRTPTGIWEEYDLGINEYNHKVIGSDSIYTYSSEKNTLKCYFQDGFTSSDSILTLAGDDTLGWTPNDLGYVDTSGNIFSLSRPLNKEPIVINNKILYPETYHDISEMFTIKEQTLKHEIILGEPLLSSFNLDVNLNKKIEWISFSGILNPSDELVLKIKGKDQTISKEIFTNEALEFITIDGSSSFNLPKPVAYELGGYGNTIDCQYYIQPLNTGYHLSILTPYDWLTDPARNYPVVIDPTVTFKFSPEELKSNDTFIAYGGGLRVNENYGGDDLLLVAGNYLNNSALIKFDLSSLPDKSIPFIDAILTMTTATFDGFDTQGIDISVHNIEQNWKEGTGTRMIPTSDGATWKGPTGTGSTWVDGDGGTYTSSYINKTIVEGTNAPYKFDISDLLDGLTGWRNRPDTNYGLLIRYEDRETFPNSYKAFHSSKSDTVSYRPKLEVSFLNTPPSVKPLNKYIWNEDEDSEKTIIDLDNHFTDVDHNVLNITLWTGMNWGQKFDCPIFTATLIDHGNLNNPEYYCYVNLKPNQFGTQIIKFNATDKISFAESDITIEIKSLNDRPILKQIGNQNAIEDEYLYVPLEVEEVENQKVFWDTNVSDYNDPNYMSNLWIDPDPDDPENDKKKILVFLPENNNVPKVDVSIIVRDEKSTLTNPSEDWENITINVLNVNDIPILTKVDYNVVIAMEEFTLSAKQNNLKSFYVQAYDEDIINGDDIKFKSNTEKADNFTITELTGLAVPIDFRGENKEVVRIDFIPGNKHVGVFEVELTVEDNDKTKDKINLIFNVEDTNDKPIIKSHEPQSGDEYKNNDYIDFSCEVDDPDLHISEDIFIEKLNVTWFTNLSGKLEILGYGTLVKNKRFKAGEYKIEILVRDKRNAEARKSFFLTIDKAITLQNDVDRNYKDNSSFDDLEYSYNMKTQRFTPNQGNYGEIDLVQLYSYYEDGKLIIRLRFYQNLTPPVDFNIRIFLVKPNHREDEPNYKPEYTQSFFEKSLYKPSEDKYYGYFTESDGKFDENNYNEFVIIYSLADLEEGVEGKFEPLLADFEIFATVKSQQTEFDGNARIENFRYDSIGYGSAFAKPPPKKGTDDNNEGFDYTGIGTIVLLVVIVVILLLVLLLYKRRKEEKDTTVIDFSEHRVASGQPQTQTQQPIPQLFMSPFEQQFRRPQQGLPPTSPYQPGQPGMQMYQQPPMQMQQPQQRPMQQPQQQQPMQQPQQRPIQQPQQQQPMQQQQRPMQMQQPQQQPMQQPPIQKPKQP